MIVASADNSGYNESSKSKLKTGAFSTLGEIRSVLTYSLLIEFTFCKLVVFFLFQASLNLDTDSSSSPIITSDNKGYQLKPAVKEKPKLPIKPRGITNKNSPDAPHVRSKTSNIKVDKKVPFRKSLSEEETNKDKEVSQVSPTGKSVSSDKCVVCGRTVYQMEKCNFDSSVLHRQCVKCSVCKRLLTVGNFVITESKVYCKPHGQAISVSL